MKQNTTLLHKNKRYAWLITRDLISLSRLCGLIGPKGCGITEEEIMATGKAFRLVGPCDVVHLEGIYVGPDDITMYAPLDELGIDYRCTGIQYRNAAGAWETL